MRIKELQINDKKLQFKKNDKLFFIKEENDFFKRTFTDAIKTVFCDSQVRLDCVCEEKQLIRCVLEKYGAEFTVTVRTNKKSFPIVKKIADRDYISGTYGNFEVSCKSNLQTDKFDKRKLKRMFDLDFREMLMPSETAQEIFFYNGEEDYTNRILWFYRERLTNVLQRYYKIDEESDKRYKITETIKSQCSAMESFIDNFKIFDLGFCKLGFDKYNREFITPETNDDGEYDIIHLCDFITANKLNGTIDKAVGENETSPLFIENAFENMSEENTEFFIKELREIDRQIFIVENRENAYLENCCDKTVDLKRYAEH